MEVVEKVRIHMLYCYLTAQIHIYVTEMSELPTWTWSANDRLTWPFFVLFTSYSVFISRGLRSFPSSVYVLSFLCYNMLYAVLFIYFEEEVTFLGAPKYLSTR